MGHLESTTWRFFGGGAVPNPPFPGREGSCYFPLKKNRFGMVFLFGKMKVFYCKNMFDNKD